MKLEKTDNKQTGHSHIVSTKALLAGGNSAWIKPPEIT